MANGTLAASQLEMLSQSGTGIMTIVPPATNTNQTLTLPDSTGTLSTLGVGTAVSASGTAVDFTGIPSWAKRITVMFSDMSTNGTSNIQVQLGDVGGVENTGYRSTLGSLGSSPAGAGVTAGFGLGVVIAANSYSGQMIITNLSGNTWTYTSTLTAGAGTLSVGGGGKTLSDTLTQVRITMANGTDTFDAGTINIMYEG